MRTCQGVGPSARTNSGLFTDIVVARLGKMTRISSCSRCCELNIRNFQQPVSRRVPEILEDGENGLPGLLRQLIERLTVNLKEMDRQVNELEKQIQRWHRENEASQRLAKIPGMGPITASAIVATVGDAREFKNGRQLAAWLGLVPRQYSSGGKSTLLGISKRGDVYLRSLLIHGARSVIRYADLKAAPDSWLRKLLARRHRNVATVALANKNARVIWALLTSGEEFQPDYSIATQAAEV